MRGRMLISSHKCQQGGDEMKPLIRWLIAGLVTVAAFAVATLICGIVVLPTIMKDGGARWGVAGGLGVAVAALA